MELPWLRCPEPLCGEGGKEQRRRVSRGSGRRARPRGSHPSSSTARQLCWVTAPSLLGRRARCRTAGHPQSAQGAAGRGREGEGVEHGVCVVCARGCVCVHILTAGLAGPRGEGGGYVSLGGLRGGERPQGKCNALSSERFIT